MPTIETILGMPNLIGLTQTVKSGIPRKLPEALFTPTRRVIGNDASFRQVKGSRRLPKAAKYGAPSRELPMQDLTEIPVKLYHTIHNQQFGQVLLKNLTAFDSPASVAGAELLIRQQMAEDEITRQTAEMKAVMENGRTALVTGAFSNGKLWFSPDGTFLFNSTGAATTVDFNLPSTNTGTAGNVIPGTTTWANTSTDIITFLISIKAKANETTGYPIKYALYGRNILKSLLANPTTSNLIYRNPVYNQSVLNGGDILTGFQGLTWVPMYDSFAEDETGAVQEFFDPDTIVFLPEITTDWYELIEGSYVVAPMFTPGGVVGADANTVRATLAQTFGMFSYAVGTNDPIGVKQVMGDTFLPVIKNPSVVYIVKANF